ncbi:MAG TPA: 50S ribosomal protein L15, partial [Chromatiaceae bacterium]|nr:50S ribosomal protein L15 [Chromatiaceae bacterium]
PLQRRLPKIGFHSRKANSTDEIRLAELAQVDGDQVNLQTLHAAGLIDKKIKRVKLIKSGVIERAVRVQG